MNTPLARMNRLLELISIWHCIFFIAVPAPLHAAPPAVSNVHGLQRAGMKLVDISYDLEDADTPALTVSIQISADGGSTWTVPVTGCTGHIGETISPGTRRIITWDAGTSWDNHYSAVVRFRVSANDGTATAPAGFVLISAGSFPMGDQSIPLRGDADEGPVHTVAVSAFYMGTTEVSFGNWQATLGWALGNGYSFENLARGKAANHPVHSVTWYDAVKWCNAKSQQDGLQPCYTVDGIPYQTGRSEPACDFTGSGYRLPTEAEWEKAARGRSTGTDFPWGDTITHSQANYRSTTAYSYDVSSTRGYHPNYRSGGMPYTSPVGAFGTSSNGFGLVDTNGNVWEWCWDWYDGDYYASSPDTDPRGPMAGSERIGRGGIWADDAEGCRTANRDRYAPAGRDRVTLTFLGFRIARGSLSPGESGSGAASGDSSDATVNTITSSPVDQDFRITNVSLEGGSFRLLFRSVTLRTYTLWQSETMAEGTWTDTGLPALSGTGEVLTFTFPAEARACRFFRVQESR